MSVTSGKQSADRLAAHYAVVRVLAEAPDLITARRALLEAIGDSLGWRLGTLWRVVPDGEELECVEVWSAPGLDAQEFAAHSRELRLGRGEGLPGRIWASAKPAWIADVGEDEDFARTSSAAAVGLRGAFGFPVYGQEGVLGAIEFFHTEVRELEPDTLELMRTLGRQVGQYVERRRADERIRASDALKAAILESALDCIVTMDHEGAIVEFNPAAERTFGYRREDVIGMEMAELIIPPSLREGHRTGLAHIVATGEGPILDQRLELTGMRSGGEEFPVELTVTRIGTGEPPMFTGYIRDITDRKRAEVERAELLEREREARLRSEEVERRSTRIAQTLQDSLVPAELPAIPGVEMASCFRPASGESEVGGDFYDVFDTGEARWAMVIGDVVGKGVRAAALTALARYTLRAAAIQTLDPSEVLELLNAALRRQTDSGDFCTAGYACLRRESDHLHVGYASGGHPLPLVLRRDGSVFEFGQSGTLLGIFDDVELPASEIQLEAGDSLVMFTDGITELRTPDGLLGREGLAAALATCSGHTAAEIVAVLEGALDAPENQTRDDVAALVLRVE